MKRILLLALTVVMASCASTPREPQSEVTAARTPSAADLTGTYLGEGLFSKRTTGIRRPAMRLYMERSQTEGDTYYGVLLEYDQLMNMGLPYMASQKAPILNKVVGYLDKIATRISVYKFVPGVNAGTYEMHNVEARDGNLVVDPKVALMLNLKNGISNPLAGATIAGDPDGQIVFPDVVDTGKGGVFSSINDALSFSQLELATLVYKKGHLASSWRGNWNDLEGSYLSEYGRFKDGVLELSTQKGQKKAKFIKTNTTKAKYFTNPKSGNIEGDYVVVEPVPKIYILVPANGRAPTASDAEMTNRIGLFLDVFDGSAPEAGSHLVTELAFTAPRDAEDFMMYYEHPQHLRNVGVEPKK
ncbi:hypothetical protein [Bdellovibrio sp. KM01]|uniref:hypothetical protein n=1 Tax=Bdellovibrio sp. KM01 TaxID=2748865 RepID=UPI0015EADDE4|nr:hypothetical protein [Bdellovibrio sp. KM01]QLY24719.1 hypothetical protein HW988_14865 [Bdellovibrio sp. KM01]